MNAGDIKFTDDKTWWYCGEQGRPQLDIYIYISDRKIKELVDEITDTDKCKDIK